MACCTLNGSNVQLHTQRQEVGVKQEFHTKVYGLGSFVIPYHRLPASKYGVKEHGDAFKVA
jgi:hypothetical protein